MENEKDTKTVVIRYETWERINKICNKYKMEEDAVVAVAISDLYLELIAKMDD